MEFHPIDPSEPPSTPSNPTANPLKYKFFGCHHSKMFLIGFPDKLRIIIHTANLIYDDIHKKAQGAYIQDFPLKADNGSTSGSSGSSSDFEKDIISYLDSYNYQKTHDWSTHGKRPLTLKQQLSLYDYSSAQVVLIPSCPGYYNVPKKSKTQGYLKLKSAVEAHTHAKKQTSFARSPLVCQFSSIGLLSEKWLKEFVFGVCSSGSSKQPENANSLQSSLKLVYPTVEEIRLSVEGYAGGNSVPGKCKNLQKKFLKPLFHKWSNDETTNPIHKGRNVPHIKTYYQLSSHDTSSNVSIDWFVLSSHNLSKAAWGEIQDGKYGKSLKICSWELGVFCSPQLLSMAAKQQTSSGKCCRLIPFGCGSPQTGDIQIPLPYSTQPQRYSDTDEPWAVDVRYNRADSFGRFNA